MLTKWWLIFGIGKVSAVVWAWQNVIAAYCLLYNLVIYSPTARLGCAVTSILMWCWGLPSLISFTLAVPSWPWLSDVPLRNYSLAHSWVDAVNISKSWVVNRHTMQYTGSLSMISCVNWRPSEDRRNDDNWCLWDNVDWKKTLFHLCF